MFTFFKKQRNIILYLLTIISSSSVILSVYNHRIEKTKNKAEPGFMMASSFENDGALCKAGSKEILCLKNIFNDFTSTKKNILFLGNSQTGAVNNFNEKDKSFVSILNKTIYDSNNQISLKGIWFPNANMSEFEKIYYLLEDCNIKIDLLIIPVFLDDTREEKVRDKIQNYDNKSCFNSKFTNENKTIKKGNVEILNNKIKKEITIFKLLEKLNKSFRVDIYKLRNFIFNIKPDSIRNIRKASYNSNLKALKNILDQRKETFEVTIIYIPPLLNFESGKKIPYKLEEYKKFKSDIKTLCNKRNCDFLNLENIIPDELWGLKSSTTLLDKNKEIDFMHFKAAGHEIMANEFSKILSKYIRKF